MEEINTIGTVIDPEVIKHCLVANREVLFKLLPEHQISILSMHSEMPNRPNSSYVDELNDRYDLKVCTKNITNFLNSKYFKHKSKFGVPNNFPLDKFRKENIVRFFEFEQKRQGIKNKYLINQLDEKHIVNSDCVPKKVRRNPIYGYMPAILVSGDFRETYNIFDCITANPNKEPMI